MKVHCECGACVPCIVWLNLIMSLFTGTQFKWRIVDENMRLYVQIYINF